MRFESNRTRYAKSSIPIRAVMIIKIKSSVKKCWIEDIVLEITESSDLSVTQLRASLNILKSLNARRAETMLRLMKFYPV